jgi:hypothetical protein
MQGKLSFLYLSEEFSMVKLFISFFNFKSLLINKFYDRPEFKFETSVDKG